MEDFETTVETWSGRFVDLARPTADDICIEDIANALSKVGRFGGATSQLWTVAQHCCLCVDLVDHNTAVARWALLHDAHEAYLGDITTPVAHLICSRSGPIDPIAGIKAALDEAICDRFGVHRSPVIQDQVDLIDRRALAIEAAEFLPSRGRGEPWQNMHLLCPDPPPNIDALRWTHHEAIASGFLTSFDFWFPGGR